MRIKHKGRTHIEHLAKEKEICADSGDLKENSPQRE